MGLVIGLIVPFDPYTRLYGIMGFHGRAVWIRLQLVRPWHHT